MSFYFKELFKPYTIDGHTLENTIAYLRKLAAVNKYPTEVVDEAVGDIFTRVASGEKFPLDKCPCGCGIDKAGTAITHAMRDRMVEIVHNRMTLYYQVVDETHSKRFDLEGDLFDLMNVVYEKIDSLRDREARQKEFRRNRSVIRHPIREGWPKVKAAWHWIETRT